ncbi:MAG: DUF1570 domain-containing protein [Planctomycetes bacterium]|nr:DUF1570 domain-containing protein [Planctomycetota bacterium]
MGVLSPALLLLLAQAGGAPAGAAAMPTVIETAHYTVESTAGAALTDELARELDRAFEEYTGRFRFDRRITERFRVRLFGDPEGYAAYAGNRYVGLYNSGSRELVIDASQRVRQVYETLYHEAFHQFLHFYIGGPMPTWIWEGIPMYFTGFRVGEDGSLGFGEPISDCIWTLQVARDEGRLHPWERLIRDMGDEFRGHDEPVSYAQAWLVHHYLVKSGGGKRRRVLDQALATLAAGKPLDIDALFEGQVAALAVALDRHAAELIEALAQAKDAYREAEVAFRAKDQAVALEAVRRGLRAYPDYPSLIAMRGYVRRAQGEHERAVKDFDAMLLQRHVWPGVLANRAACLLELGRREEARADVDRCLGLAPDNVLALSLRERLAE